ncbi:hypothetical protein GDO81_010663 [Engystomops pustulosus]|uniref:Uncharacterized protein n=1 Tax=Engystomops pustulosus TaxID=76066 RepID=A0AAV7C378_ENGPU|nr:hypothetical protein GDO81_010663 [Engystomops pustulosus]
MILLQVRVNRDALEFIIMVMVIGNLSAPGTDSGIYTDILIFLIWPYLLDTTFEGPAQFFAAVQLSSVDLCRIKVDITSGIPQH